MSTALDSHTHTHRGRLVGHTQIPNMKNLLLRFHFYFISRCCSCCQPKQVKSLRCPAARQRRKVNPVRLPFCSTRRVDRHLVLSLRATKDFLEHCESSAVPSCPDSPLWPLTHFQFHSHARICWVAGVSFLSSFGRYMLH